MKAQRRLFWNAIPTPCLIVDKMDAHYPHLLLIVDKIVDNPVDAAVDSIDG